MNTTTEGLARQPSTDTASWCGGERMRWHAIGKLMRDHAPSIDFHRFSALHTQCYHWIDWIDRPTVKYTYTETVGTRASPRVCDFQRPTVLLVVDCSIFSDSFISWPYLRQAGASFGRMVFARRKWMPFVHGVVFIFFVGTVIFELTFGRCKNSNLIIYFCQGFYSWKGTFQCHNPKWLDQYFETKVLNTLPKTSHSTFFYFCYSVLCQRKRMWTQKDMLLRWDELGSLGLRGIFPGLDIKATNFKNLMLCFPLCIQKNINWKFFVDLSWMDDPKVLLTEQKSWKIAHDFFDFAQWQKVSLIVILTLAKMKSFVLSPRARGIHVQWSARRLFTSAKLPFKSK